MLLIRNWAYSREAILQDLERAHPDIRRCVAPRDAGIYFANSDLSGFSIFEEAQYWAFGPPVRCCGE
ncbi:MAG: hypothetical protein M3Z09_12335 [Acidobacteriota bacterium]|nr:hypothetical protein [Acidobacteriota bacterium]